MSNSVEEKEDRKEKQKFHIILDIDGTLIDNVGDSIYQRPYLKEFLDYCFETFETVSIWTAASREWYNEVNEKIFSKLKLKTKESLQSKLLTPRKFYFVWTGERCTFISDQKAIEDGDFYAQRIKIKRLKKIWDKRGLLTRHNTLILDDTPITYAENYGNAIPIDTYNHKNEDDDSLLKLIEWLPNLFDKHIRSTEKRKWNYS
jgi:TFIIF-interacting CTD phosphatase-like protein